VRLDEIRPLLHEFLEPALGFLQMSGGGVQRPDLKLHRRRVRAQHERVPQMRSGALSVAVVPQNRPQVKQASKSLGPLAARGGKRSWLLRFAAAQQSSPIIVHAGKSG